LVTAPDRAADLCESPIYVYAVEEAHVARYVTGIEDLTTSPAAITGPRALAKAGVALDDIDVFELYDSFTIAVILTLEGLGLCPRGEGGRFVEDGRLRQGGGLPVNTNGGGLSNRHPGMLGDVPPARGGRPAPERGRCPPGGGRGDGVGPRAGWRAHERSDRHPVTTIDADMRRSR